ncbi:expansin EXLX1 family cellulose-binding protein [Streptomyces sp. CRN 30]|uniref:expansin EXLX1 family cellulose-binding protein n=1 Tax=Streptomyces sp. CRN 30 TaxID=3075613 RepID=UPI002A829F10|nr:expansin EXLX1 family cellulose-binding protein [Streptomyces sp. CRN 30]
MASPSHRHRHRRPPRTRRRTALVPAVVVAAAVLAVSLVVALRPGSEADTVQAEDTSVADARVSPSATESKPETGPEPTRSTASPSTSPTASPTAKSADPTPSTRPSTASAPAPTRQAAAPASGSLAGRIRPGTTYDGIATHYDAADGDGACSFGPSPDMMIAAMNTTDYETSKACGAHVLVRAANGASVTVRITNECPSPCAPGQIDLSRQAFAELAALSVGELDITWSLLSPGTSDTISIRYKTGSTQYWCGIQAIGHRNPLARLEVGTGNGWQRLTRTEYNYFLSPDGTGCGGPLRLTDVHGEQLTVEGIAVRPDAVQPSGVQFSRR